MSRFVAIVAVAAGITASGCGATTRSGSVATSGVVPPLTSATVTFVTRDNGKDTDSAATVQLLRNNAELAAEVRTAGVEFDDNTTSAPMSLALSAPFRLNDIEDGQVRVRMTPDGRDDWSFDMRLMLQFADGSTRNFFWSNIRLDNAAAERVLALSIARVP